MKRVATLILVLLSFAIATITLHAEDAATAPAAEAKPSDAGAPANGEQPAAPEGPLYDGAVNARDLEIKEFFDASSAIEKKATELRAAVSGAATPEQIARAKQTSDELTQFIAAKQAFINRWPNWPEFTDYSKGLPNDKTARFGNRGCRFAIGDFNEDGKPDLAAVSIEGDGFYVWLNNGDGTWTESRKNLDNSKFTGGVALTADFNGDGHLDLLFALPHKRLYEYKGDGKGNWEEVDTGLKDEYAFMDIHCADMDGDKDIDVVMTVSKENKDANGAVLSPTNRVIILENDGTGKFTEKDLALPAEIANPMPFVLADVNNDGKVDFISTTPYYTKGADGKIESSSIAIWLNQGNNAWALAAQRPVLPVDTQIDYIACADLNGDGLQDVVCTLHNADIVIGGFIPRERLKEAGISPDRIAKPLHIYLNGGQGPWKEIAIDAALTAYSSIDVADVNGDGNPDIIMLGLRNGETTIVLGDGKGGFKECFSTLPSMEEWSVYVKACDIDGDGAADIVAYYTTPPGQAALFPESVKTFRIWRNVSVYSQVLHRIDSIKKTLAEIK